MQIDGYSLDAQKARMKAYADFNDCQIVGEYEDAGKLRCLGVFSVGFRCQQNTGAKNNPPGHHGKEGFDFHSIHSSINSVPAINTHSLSILLCDKCS